MKVYVNGKFLDEDKAVISVFDRAFLYGDGIFETMRSYGGIVFRLERHLNRLYSSMKSLKIRPRFSNKETEKSIYELLRVNSLKDASIRITVSRGISKDRKFNISQNDISGVVITAGRFAPRPVKYYETGIKADVACFRRNSRSFSSNFKAINYLDAIIARNEAVPKGSFETIFLNEADYVCEGSVTNVFMVTGNKLMTPSLDCGVLPGITRKVVLELAPYAALGIEEGKFSEEKLRNCEEIFVTNSLIEIIPVVKIGEKQIGNGKVGSVTRKIHSLYKDLVKRETGCEKKN